MSSSFELYGGDIGWISLAPFLAFASRIRANHPSFIVLHFCLLGYKYPRCSYPSFFLLTKYKARFYLSCSHPTMVLENFRSIRYISFSFPSPLSGIYDNQKHHEYANIAGFLYWLSLHLDYINTSKYYIDFSGAMVA